MLWVEEWAGRAYVWSGRDATSYKPRDAALGHGRGEGGTVPVPAHASVQEPSDTWGISALLSPPRRHSADSLLKFGLSAFTSISGERNGRAYWSGLRALLCFSLDSFPVWFACINRQVTFLCFQSWWLYVYQSSQYVSKVSQERWLACEFTKDIFKVIVSIYR